MLRPELLAAFQSALYQLECPFMSAANSVDWIQMSNTLGELQWRAYVEINRSYRDALRTV